MNEVLLRLESADYVPVPLGGADYIELLPARWQSVNAHPNQPGRRGMEPICPCGSRKIARGLGPSGNRRPLNTKTHQRKRAGGWTE
ncbi:MULTISPECIES: hypothetical protein [unclassified Streptomyces]|uniref:hypothetical protein n=1 Tax=unclassified Streptomyces TaxID=2593676 RepID=UPI00225BF75A|nr:MULTISPECIES: hypothetical protein [unclassified Streptomyces]WSU26851.1 hypothetical protein OG508_39195 [Streptomyces sp. NBC_01108]MCX4792393.1 hypothetical protein [Streptomyces sp. NBC_01221]MCX4799871.1 hypothetical protein [Streptomyces sp. NBC_01242]WSJ41369.1 hypothetical protein OG772_36990 [Streptomyces sp. NBC_01321]WSP67833.1 hypothetical protein OG466_39430 [Streptomyces sp. NBC_01240]